MKNVLIIHGGGPTAVINASLYGAVHAAQQHPETGHIYAAINGTGGLLKKQVVDLKDLPEDRLALLLKTPGSAIGSSRDELEAPEYAAMAEILKELEIDCVLMNGGNGTMDTCGKLNRMCKEKGMDICVMGIPKTIDNDLSVTDHSPGYASAARYIAESVREVCADVQGLPIHVCVIEAQGRNAGWITAAAALAGNETTPGPDLIYLPERPFDEDAFISDIEKLLEKKRGIVVVCSEGLKDKDGREIVEPIFTVGRSTYFGDVSAHLANLVIKRLGYKARGEKPGLLGRASIHLASPIDQQEAILAGEEALKAAMKGESGKMVAFRRVSSEPYCMEPFLVDIDEVMMHERKMPDEFINEAGNGVTEAFKEWCRPLLGVDLPDMIHFN